MRPAMRLAIPILAAGLLALGWTRRASQGAAQNAEMVVTVEPNGNTWPTLGPDSVEVLQHGTRDRIAELLPARGAHGDMQLFLLIDGDADPSLASAFPQIRSFFATLPPEVKIGVATMEFGTSKVWQQPTNDRNAAGKALRMPTGEAGISSSPYDSLRELITHWPAPAAERREVLMLASGIDLTGGPNPDNPLFLRAIAAAQQAGVVVYSIYVPAVGHLGHDFWRINSGQNHLSELSDETGGEFYFLTAHGQLINDDLQQVAGRLQHQYLLSFRPAPGSKAGLEPITVQSTQAGVSVTAASAVAIP